jgi:AcrR family transcriptional regulator
MPKGPTKRRPQTLSRLLDAAFDAFAELGFHAATIPEICRRAGYTHGAFYSNFASKNELFFALFDRHAAKEIDRLTAITTDLEARTLDELAALVAHTDEEERSWFMVSTEFTLHAIRDPEAAAKLAEHDARIRAEIVRVLEALLRRTGRTTEVDLEQLARLFIAIREGGLAQSYVEPGELPPGSLDRAFLPLIFDAIAQRPPRV